MSSISGSLLPATSPMPVGYRSRSVEDNTGLCVGGGDGPATGLMAGIKVASGSALVMLIYSCYVCIIYVRL